MRAHGRYHCGAHRRHRTGSRGGRRTGAHWCHCTSAGRGRCAVARRRHGLGRWRPRPSNIAQGAGRAGGGIRVDTSAGVRVSTRAILAASTRPGVCVDVQSGFGVHVLPAVVLDGLQRPCRRFRGLACARGRSEREGGRTSGILRVSHLGRTVLARLRVPPRAHEDVCDCCRRPADCAAEDRRGALPGARRFAFLGSGCIAIAAALAEEGRAMRSWCDYRGRRKADSVAGVRRRVSVVDRCVAGVRRFLISGSWCIGGMYRRMGCVHRGRLLASRGGEGHRVGDHGRRLLRGRHNDCVSSGGNVLVLRVRFVRSLKIVGVLRSIA